MRFRRRGDRPESDVVERVEPLNEAERQWVAMNVAEATRLEGALSPKSLDRFWTGFLAADPEDPNPAINMVGLAFGQLLADRLNLSWVALTDRHGTEIALRGRSNFTVFPTVFIAKRYETRETEFISAAYDEFVRAAEAIG